MATRPDPDGEPGPDPVSTDAPDPGSPDSCTVPDDAPARPVGRLAPDRCSVQALDRGDPVVATASPSTRWLLVEQPGPWGRDALTESRFDGEVAPRLAARARAEGVRVLLVRRSGGRLAESGRRWAYVDGRPGREGLWWAVRDRDADLLEVPWDGSVGERAAQPTYLVCTHGGHDACCALRGRPLARTLPAADVWECSHLGGCRFAANVLVLPSGFYYGQVPGDGAEVVAAHGRGEVALPWLRGRAGQPPQVQAAQQHAREELGLLGMGDLAPVDVRAESEPGGQPERWTVVLAGSAGPVTLEVTSRPAAGAARLTCRAVHPAHPRTWDVRTVAAV